KPPGRAQAPRAPLSSGRTARSEPPDCCRTRTPMADYSFVTRWFIDAPIERVFSAIEAAPRWPSWWKAVVAVEVVESGDADGIGAVARTTWRTALGYRLRFDARLVRRTSP